MHKTRHLTTTDPKATAALALRLAAVADIGDVILLHGDIGAGKSTLARAFIRARLDNPHEDVPSPTFTIAQIYDHPRGDIWHCDLYRLSDAQEVLELGLDDAFTAAICLIEWPDLLTGIAPADALTITMTAHKDHHSITLTGPGRLVDAADV